MAHTVSYVLRVVTLADLSVRPAKPSDAEAIVALSGGRARRFLGVADLDLAEFQALLSVPGRDLARSTVTAWSSDGDLLGFGYVADDESGSHTSTFTDVAELIESEPAHRELVELVDHMAAEAGRPVVHGCVALDEPALAVLRALGMRELRRFDLMWRELAAPIDAPFVPAGVQLRPFDVDRDLAPVYACLAAAFEDHFGGGFPTFEAFRHTLASAESFNPDLWVVCFGRVGVVGAAVSTPTFPERDGYGYLTDLGVLREHRGHGLGSALLQESFRRLQAAGRTGCALHVDADSETGARRLYERAGMTREARYVTYGVPS